MRNGVTSTLSGRARQFEVDTSGGAAPILSVFGGKITTYRRLAEEALDRLAPYLGSLSAKHWTGTEPLPGGDFDVTGRQALAASLLAAHPFLGPDEALRIISAYGTLASEWLGNSRDRGALGRNFGGGLSQAEVDYSMDREWARTPQDILWRRTKLGLRLDASGVAALGDHMQSRLG